MYGAHTMSILELGGMLQAFRLPLLAAKPVRCLTLLTSGQSRMLPLTGDCYTIPRKGLILDPWVTSLFQEAEGALSF